jgi:hypothetical protein
MTRTPNGRAKRELENLEPVAGNGLLDRRAWLRGGAALAGVMTRYTLLPPHPPNNSLTMRGALCPALLFRTTARDPDLKKMSCAR